MEKKKRGRKELITEERFVDGKCLLTKKEAAFKNQYKYRLARRKNNPIQVDILVEGRKVYLVKV